MTPRDVEIFYDEPVNRGVTEREDGIEIPVDRISPETLQNLIGEYVSREWEELGDGSCTLEQKIDQVRQQLKNRKAKLVFDLTTNSCNIVASR